VATLLAFDDNLKGIAWFDPGLLPETWFHREVELGAVAPIVTVVRETVIVKKETRGFIVPHERRITGSD